MFTSAGLYGTSPQAPLGGVASVTQPMGVYSQGAAQGYKSMLDPHNPIMWLGVFLLATVGAAGISGSARLGPARVSGGVGK